MYMSLCPPHMRSSEGQHLTMQTTFQTGSKINASNSGSDSWTGIGVVAGFGAVVLIMQWPHRRNGEVIWSSELLQRLQEVRGNCKTRNQLTQKRRGAVPRLSQCLCATNYYKLSDPLLTTDIEQVQNEKKPFTLD